MGIFGLIRDVWLGDKRTVGAEAAAGPFCPDPSTYFPNFAEQLSARQSTVGGAAAGGKYIIDTAVKRKVWLYNF